MAKKRTDESLYDAVAALIRWLRSEHVSFMIIGGFAVSLLGRPRATRDVDAVMTIPNDRWKALLESGKPFGIEPRMRDCLAFAQESMVFLLKHLPSSTPIDLSIGSSEFEQQALAHRHSKRLKRLNVPLPRVEDIIIMKAVARRPVDFADISTLLMHHHKVDKQHILHWLDTFSELLQDDSLIRDFEQCMKNVMRKGR